MRSSAAATLRNALLLVRQGNLADARERLLDAQHEGLRSPQEALALAALRFVTRDYYDSLAALDQAVDLGAGPVALRQKARDAVRLGWELDACSTLQHGAALFPRDPSWRSALLALHARRRDHEGAFRHGEELLARKPQASEALIELASLRIAQGERRVAKTLLDAALSQPLSEPAKVEVARLRRASGSFPEARALLASLAAGPLGAEARRMLAELALWSGEADQAEEILAALGEGPGTARLRGILAALRGQSDEALRLFERAVALDPEDSEALVWLAEQASLRGEHERARGFLTRAMMSARGQLLVASLLWLLNDLRAGPIPPSLPPALVEHLLPVTTLLCPDLGDPWRACSASGLLHAPLP
jgi:tetratricopeptide (TPR) repeat protein